MFKIPLHLYAPLPDLTIDELTLLRIYQALQQFEQNRTYTAVRLDISVRQLRYRLTQLRERGVKIEDGVSGKRKSA